MKELELKDLRSAERNDRTIDKATEQASRGVEHQAARKIVAQEQVIKRLQVELDTANAAQEYLESLQMRQDSDHKLALEQMMHWEDRAKAAEGEVERLRAMKIAEMQANQDSFVADHITPSVVSVKQVRVNPAEALGATPRGRATEDEVRAEGPLQGVPAGQDFYSPSKDRQPPATPQQQ